MADIKSFPNNQDTYIGAEWVMKWLHGRTSGVFGANGNAAVSAVPGAMAIEVTDGVGWLSNEAADGIVWWNDSELSIGEKLKLDVDVADGVLNRIDRVVVSWETTNYVALPTITVLKGTPSSNAVPPTLTNNNILRQISLAQISIPAGTISLIDALITDERLDETVCGIVTERIEVDTSMIWGNVSSTLEDVKSQSDAVLLSIQEELASIIGGTGFDPSPIRALNVAVSPDLFTEYEPDGEEETAISDLGYIYRAAVPIEGAISSMYPYITWSLPSIDASGADILNQYSAYNGGVYVYAADAPGGDILALTIEMRKAVD